MKIYWYCPDAVNSAFKNPLDNPSYRLRCWLNNKDLVKGGYLSKIVNNTKDIVDPDVLVLMSFGEEEYNLARYIKSRGGKVIHDYTENIRGISILESTKKLCDKIVCCSTELGRLESVDYGEKAIVIKDPIEEYPSPIARLDLKFDKLKVMWCGMGGNNHLPRSLKPIIESAGMSYVEVSNAPDTPIPWNRDNWYSQMLLGDICICPQMHWQFPAKSNIKVTTAMSLGIPVLASPILSYTELIKNGENGYICHTYEDWYNYLIELRDTNKREQISKNAFKYLNPYRQNNIHKEWLKVLKG